MKKEMVEVWVLEKANFKLYGKFKKQDNLKSWLYTQY